MTTPVISISTPPHVSTSSGSSGATSSKVVMRRLLGRQRGSLGRGNGVVVVFEQLRNRSRGYVEDRLWHDTKQNGECDQRGEDDAFAPANVANAFQRRLELAKNHPAVQPQRIGSRQDDAEGRKRRNRDVHLESTDQ